MMIVHDLKDTSLMTLNHVDVTGLKHAAWQKNAGSGCFAEAM